LAAIAVPKFADMVTKSKEASAKGSLGAVRSAVSIYYGDMEGEFPGNLYDGLTSADKYMSAAQGLGNFTIPKNGTYSAPGHSSVITVAANVAQGSGPASDAAGVYYFDNGTRRGEVFINCTHKDTKGSVWTFY
jgi:type II secretory pathway pseudopilin PulG